MRHTEVAVNNGMAYLDSIYGPGHWEHRISLSTLDVRLSPCCTLAQVEERDYNKLVVEYGLTAVFAITHGFFVDETGDWAALTREWKHAISKRRTELALEEAQSKARRGSATTKAVLRPSRFAKANRSKSVRASFVGRLAHRV